MPKMVITHRVADLETWLSFKKERVESIAAILGPRLALPAVPALVGLGALGLQRWTLGVRFLFPRLLLDGKIFAIQTNVPAVHWS